jgi:tRNA threonylcarbamoyladenosine biosynthesis protein TsaE
VPELKENISITTAASEETERLGEALARLLPPGSLVALRGDLATGKTCLVRGMARHFAPENGTHSPTFTLVNEYGRENRLYHLDLYRLSGPEELADLGFEELFDPDGVCVVEWAERAGNLLPENRVDIMLEHGGGDIRRLTIGNRDLLPAGWREILGI